MHAGMKLGPFVIEDEIGSGAMGAVYRAQYRDKPLRVAIKVMAPGLYIGVLSRWWTQVFQWSASISANRSFSVGSRFK